jgi:hypothetical protein
MTAIREQALDALVDMRRIVLTERIGSGNYYVPEGGLGETNPGNAVCGGRRFCAIGALWAAYGVQPAEHISGVNPAHWVLPGTDEDERPGFIATRPALRMALDALNAASVVYANEHDLSLNDESYGSFRDSLEALFEGHWSARFYRDDLIAVIDAAIDALEATDAATPESARTEVVA